MIATADKIQLTTTVRALRKALSFVGGAIAANPIIPALENVLFSFDEDENFILTGTDLRTTLTARLAIDVDEDQIPFNFCIVHKTVTQLLSTMPDGPVTLTVKPNKAGATLKTETGSYKLPGDTAKDYPRPPAAEYGDVYTADFPPSERADFITRLSHVLFAVAPPNVSKQHMEGVCLSGNNLCATDGARAMALTEVNLEDPSDRQFIVPIRTAQLLVKLSDSVDTEQGLQINLSSRSIHCQFDNHSIYSPLIDETFVDFALAKTLTYPICWTVDRLGLIASLKRASVFTNSITNLVQLESDRIGSIAIKAQDVDLAQQADERISADGTGEIVTVNINGKLMIDCLSNLTGELVNINLAPTGPNVMLTGNEEGTKIFVFTIRD